MISIIITTFKEPNTIGRAIESFLNQNIKEKYELIVSAPDKETESIVKDIMKKNKPVKFVKDEGKGKTAALNKVLKRAKGRLFILSDGDVYVNSDSVNEILDLFKDKEMGCVTGRPVPQEDRSTIHGYWSNLLFFGAHLAREKRANKSLFIECSGYLWAFKPDIIKEIPSDVAEDTILPCLIYEKGYKTGYASKAEVYVKNPNNIKDWIKQKTRTSKAHELLSKYVNTKEVPKMKSLKNEILEGTGIALSYPRNLKELIWTIALFKLRLYMWVNVFISSKLLKKHFSDAWERIESTK